MSIINSQPLIGASGNQGGYNLTKSLRFRASASAYIARTPAAASNRRTFTWSGWVKAALNTSKGELFTAGVFTSNNYSAFFFNASTSQLQLNIIAAGAGAIIAQTPAVFRDPAAWYHIVLAVDTTQAINSNGVKFYVNGVQQTLTFPVTYTQNYQTDYNSVITHNIGRIDSYSSEFFDGYMAEVNFIDGTQKAASDFGETDSITGVWKPKAYSGTYGTNGFYLKFTDVATTSGSNAGLGKDFSGNGNYWNTNNISVTSGATYDSMTDVPTLTSATVANYCVLNPLDKGALDVTAGNLTFQRTSSTTDWEHSRGTIQLPSTGKWYWESKFNSGTNDGVFNGVATSTANLSTDFAGGAYAGMYGYSSLNGNIYNNNTNTTLGSSLSNGDVVMIAVDVANTNLWIGVNGTWLGSGNPATNTNASIGSIPTGVFPVCGSRSTGNGSVNFGQQGFTYTPPTGFKALNTYNLPDSTIVAGNKYMDATTYTGNGSTQSITNAGGFKPDLVWVKARSVGYDHVLYDSVRGTGTTKSLGSNITGAEGANSIYTNLTSFDSNGFSVGTTSSTNILNNNTSTFVGWQWQAGQGTTSSNTSGSITSTVSVNASAGFSVVTWTGNGSTNATVGHGLGVAPKMYIVKRRDSTGNWVAFVQNITGSNQFLVLNATDAIASASQAAPSSTILNVFGSFDNINAATYVAYCWSEIPGFSKFSSYVGNGSADGSFVYCGFRPKFVMVKRSNAVGNWIIYDATRNSYNVANNMLFPNTSDAEDTGGAVDILSNGFKARSTSASWNGSGDTYIFMAFAENPQKLALAR